MSMTTIANMTLKIIGIDDNVINTGDGKILDIGDWKDKRSLFESPIRDSLLCIGGKESHIHLNVFTSGRSVAILNLEDEYVAHIAGV